MSSTIRRVVSRMESVVREAALDPFEGVTLSTPDRVADLLRSLIGDESTEHFVALSLDVRHRVTGFWTVSQGTLTASLVHPREVFGPALRIGNVAAVILAHQHPSGDPTPSLEDEVVTKRMAEAGKILGVPVLDHVVIGLDSYQSMRQRGAL